MLKSLYLSILLLVCFFTGCADEQVLSKSFDYDITKALEVKNIMPAVVIGSGPAGLSAALYLARANVSTLVISGETPGGQITETTYVENWPGIKKKLGSEIIKDLKEQAASFGVEFLNASIKEVDFSTWPFKLVTDDGVVINTLSVIIATGASVKKLDVPGMKEFWGKGITSCAICDAPFYQDKDVVVIGGGDSAIEETLQLSSYAKNIYILVRRDKMRAASSMQNRISELKNVKILYNTQVNGIIGDNSGIKAVKVTEEDVQHEIPISGVFLAIGRMPNSEIFKNYLELDEQGYIKIGCNSQECSIRGIFAAGDVEDSKFRQASVAVGKGVQAALESISFLMDIGFNEILENKIRNNIFKVEKVNKVDFVDVLEIEELKKELSCCTDKLVIVDFWATWCPSCLKLIPIVEAVAGMFADKVKIIKVNTGKSLKIAKAYSVPTIPTLLFFKNEKLIDRRNDINKKDLIDIVNNLVKDL